MKFKAGDRIKIVKDLNAYTDWVKLAQERWGYIIIKSIGRSTEFYWLEDCDGMWGTCNVNTLDNEAELYIRQPMKPKEFKLRQHD